MTSFFHFKKQHFFSLNYKLAQEKLKHCFMNGHLVLALSIAYLFFLNNTVNLKYLVTKHGSIYYSNFVSVFNFII